jgi:hypothetical protein
MLEFWLIEPPVEWSRLVNTFLDSPHTSTVKPAAVLLLDRILPQIGRTVTLEGD